MNDKEKIDIVRGNWLKASKELGFNIISPYSVIEGKKNYVFFAYIPEYGSSQGTIVDIVFAPKYQKSKKMIEIANIKGCFYSFVNIDAFINYDRECFLDMIEDWGKY